MKFYCECKKEGVPMKYSRSADAYICSECGNVLCCALIEDIVKPLMQNISCLKLPTLDKPIFVKK